MADNIEVKVAEHEVKIKSLEKRVLKTEEIAESVHELCVSIEKLALIQENMLAEQKAQRKDIDDIKQQPAKDAREIKVKIIIAVATGIISALLGALLAVVIK